MFAKLYAKVLLWSKLPRAPWYLAGVSVAEASFFPIPTDVMLAPMVMSRRDQAWFLAGLTTVTSVLGGVIGYMIGMFAFELVEPWLLSGSRAEHYATVQHWFTEYGVWVVFIGGFTPIPYKIFTITAGAAAMALLPFVLASLVARGLRYTLVAAMVRYGGPMFERHLLKYIDWLGWACVLGLALLYFFYRH